MLHLKNLSNLNRKMAKDILRESRRLASGMDLILRDCRISTKYIELDTSIPKSNLDELIEKLSPIGPLDHAKHVVEEIVEKKRQYLMESHISIMKDFGNVMKFLKVFGKIVLVMRSF